MFSEKPGVVAWGALVGGVAAYDMWAIHNDKPSADPSLPRTQAFRGPKPSAGVWNTLLVSFCLSGLWALQRYTCSI